MTINTKLGKAACTRMIVQLLIDISARNLRYGYITCHWTGDLPVLIEASRSAMQEHRITAIEIERDDITVRNSPTMFRTISIMPGLF